MSPGTENPKLSGIKVIIVGAGFAGLTAAIECHRKGHEALVLESFAELKVLGDIISKTKPSAWRNNSSHPAQALVLMRDIFSNDGPVYQRSSTRSASRQKA